MMNGWQEGVIKIPVQDGDAKIAHYWVKAYDEPSEYGIDEGKISKLTIKIDGEMVVNYDRGWDIEPNESDEVVWEIYRFLLQAHN